MAFGYPDDDPRGKATDAGAFLRGEISYREFNTRKDAAKAAKRAAELADISRPRKAMASKPGRRTGAHGGSGPARGMIAERTRLVARAVAEDPACEGKAELALAMLADDDYAGLSASGIVKLLAKHPADSASAADPEAAALAEMRAAIAETPNSKIDANGGGPSQARAEDPGAVWDRVQERLYGTK